MGQAKDNLFYVITGTIPTELHIHRTAVPTRKRTGTLCGRGQPAWIERPMDQHLTNLPICEPCQEIFDDYEDGLDAERQSSHG